MTLKRRLLSALPLVMVGATIVDAQLPMRIPHDTEPYAMTWNGDRNSSPLRIASQKPGPCAENQYWDFKHFPAGGFADRGFARFIWCDSNVTRKAALATTGWMESGRKFRPTDGWSPKATYYVRFRVRVNAPLLGYDGGPVAECDNDTQLKFFIWNSFPDDGDGNDRMIIEFHSGKEGGGSELTQTTIDINAGVSGRRARTLIKNGEWVNLQFATAFAESGAPFQKIYVNNNVEASPTVANVNFTGVTYNFHDQTKNGGGLDGVFFWGNMANTGSCTRRQAEIDLMDFQIDTKFDANWGRQP